MFQFNFHNWERKTITSDIHHKNSFNFNINIVYLTRKTQTKSPSQAEADEAQNRCNIKISLHNNSWDTLSIFKTASTRGFLALRHQNTGSLVCSGASSLKLCCSSRADSSAAFFFFCLMSARSFLVPSAFSCVFTGHIHLCNEMCSSPRAYFYTTLLLFAVILQRNTFSSGC